MKSLYRDLVRAVANGDTATAKELDGQLTDQDRSTYQGYLTTVFAVMLGVRFEEDTSRAEIDRFVEQVRQGYKDRSAKPLALEGIIRALLNGEEHLMEEISSEDQMRAQVLAVRAITATVPKVAENLDTVLEESARLYASEME